MSIHGAEALCLLALISLSLAVRADAPPEADPSLDEPPLITAPAKPKTPDRGSLTDEIGTLQPSNTTGNPTGPSYSNNLSAIFNVSDKWSLDVGFLLTLEQGAPAPPGSMFADSGGHVSLFTLGADWDSGKHWSFDFLSDLSPKSTTNSSTTLTTALGNGGTDILTDARLTATSSNIDLVLGTGYDTNGDSNAEWIFTGSVTGGNLNTSQKVTAVQDRRTGTAISAMALQTYCTNHPKICGKALTSALEDRDYLLDSLKLTLGTTLTLFEATDLTVSGDYFLYAQDPSEVGYFNVATAGRALAGGAGVPIAPLRIDGRVDSVHRFGALSLKLYATAGEYAVDADGITYGFGAKAQYRFSRTWRAWITASVQHDVDDTGDDLETWGLSAGVGVRF